MVLSFTQQLKEISSLRLCCSYEKQWAEKIQTINTKLPTAATGDGNTSTIFFTFHLRVVKQFMTIILKVKSTRIVENHKIFCSLKIKFQTS